MTKMWERVEWKIPSRKEQEKYIYDIFVEELITAGWFERKEIKVTYIDDDLLSVGTEKNISFYCNQKWNILFNIGYIRKQLFFQDFLSTAGYHETKNMNGEYKLSRTNQNSRNLNEISKGGEQIPLYSKEYFSAWEDMEFYRNKLTIDIFRRPDNHKKYHTLSEEKIQELSSTKTLRARDLMSLLEHKQITQKIYDTYIWKAIEQLPVQLRDLRFNRIRDNVTISEVQELLKKRIITKEMYDIFSKRITSRNELLENKELAKSEAKKDTLSEIGSLKQRIIQK